jgi:hypothetical protein
VDLASPCCFDPEDAVAGFSFSWTLHHHGWAVCGVADSLAGTEADASYVTDAPEDFITAVARLMLGTTHTSARFEGEPSVYRWLFDRDGDQVDIRLLEAPTRQTPEVLIWASRQPIDVVVRAVIRAFDAVEAEHGLAGYQATWGRPFPSVELGALRSAWRDQRESS